MKKIIILVFVSCVIFACDRSTKSSQFGSVDFFIDKLGVDFESAEFIFSKISLEKKDGRLIHIQNDKVIDFGKLVDGTHTVVDHAKVPVGKYQSIHIEFSFNKPIEFFYATKNEVISSSLLDDANKELNTFRLEIPFLNQSGFVVTKNQLSEIYSLWNLNDLIKIQYIDSEFNLYFDPSSIVIRFIEDNQSKLLEGLVDLSFEDDKVDLNNESSLVDLSLPDVNPIKVPDGFRRVLIYGKYLFEADQEFKKEEAYEIKNEPHIFIFADIVDGDYRSEWITVRTDDSEWKDVYYLLDTFYPTPECQKDCFIYLNKKIQLDASEDESIWTWDANEDELPNPTLFSELDSQLVISLTEAVILDNSIVDNSENCETLTLNHKGEKDYPMMIIGEWSSDRSQHTVKYLYTIEEVLNFYQNNSENGFNIYHLGFNGNEVIDNECNFTTQMITVWWTNDDKLQAWSEWSKNKKSFQFAVETALSVTYALAGSAAIAGLASLINRIVKSKRLDAVPDLDVDTDDVLKVLNGTDEKVKEAILERALLSKRNHSETYAQRFKTTIENMTFENEGLDKAVKNYIVNGNANNLEVVVRSYYDAYSDPNKNPSNDMDQLGNLVRFALRPEGSNIPKNIATSNKLIDKMQAIEDIRNKSTKTTKEQAMLDSLDMNADYTKTRVLWQARLLIEDLDTAAKEFRTIINTLDIPNNNKQAVLAAVPESSDNNQPIRKKLTQALKSIPIGVQRKISENLVADSEASKLFDRAVLSTREINNLVINNADFGGEKFSEQQKRRQVIQLEPKGLGRMVVNLAKKLSTGIGNVLNVSRLKYDINASLVSAEGKINTPPISLKPALQLDGVNSRPIRLRK